MFALLVGVACWVSASAVAAAASTPPRTFELIFEGAHNPGIGPTNFQHEGSFAASAPLCASGRGADRQLVQEMAVLREFTCEDGSGSFTAVIDPIIAEHGGPGVWKIMGGTGRYSKLRARGTFEGEFVSGTPTDETTITFRSTWKGMAAFDDVAPTISVVRAGAMKLRRSPGMYLLRVVFSARDDLGENTVEYRVLTSSGSSRMPFSEGRTTSGNVSITLRVRPPSRARQVLVEIRAIDPVGNERRIVRSLRLPS